MTRKQLAQQQALVPSIAKALQRWPMAEQPHVRHQGARERARRLRFEAKMLQRAGERDWQETRLSRAAADRQRAAQWIGRHIVE